jgi:hypothetical protein
MQHFNKSMDDISIELDHPRSGPTAIINNLAPDNLYVPISSLSI